MPDPLKPSFRIDPAVWQVLELAVTDHDFLSLFLTNIDDALKSKGIELTYDQRSQLDLILETSVPLKTGQELLQLLNRIYKYYDDPILNPTPPPPPTW
jgi:hypothetical protein